LVQEILGILEDLKNKQTKQPETKTKTVMFKERTFSYQWPYMNYHEDMWNFVKGANFLEL
jgi:hypothetical protein